MVQTVPEPEAVVPRASPKHVSRSSTDDLAQRLNERALPDREGLPQHYRMRADAHYVDRLESLPQPVMRLLAIAQIDGTELPAPDGVVALTKSILMHGVLQPLMVRKQGARYRLITGRKRLTAARAAGLSAIPCLLDDIDEDVAVALAAADNLRGDSALEGMPRPRIEVHADALQSRALKIEVVQRSVRVVTDPGAPGEGLADDEQMPVSELLPALALRLARQVVASHGGHAELTPLPGRGSVLQMIFPLPSSAVTR